MKAEALIREGNSLRQQGLDQRALPLFQNAYELTRSGRTVAQLGLCELALGYWVEADEHLTEALSAPSQPWIENNRAVLTESVEKARAHIATIAVTGSPAGAEVTAHGRVVGALPLARPIRLVEGQVEIVLKHPDYATVSRTLKLMGGTEERLQVNLQKVAQVSNLVQPSTTTPPNDSSSVPAWRRAAPWVTLATAAGAVGFAVFEHIAWQGGVTDFDAETFRLPSGQTVAACAASATKHGMTPRCDQLYSDYTSARTLAFVGYGVGGVLAVTSAILFFRRPDESRASTSKSARAAMCSPDLRLAGLACAFTF
ncbi:MAG TPA: PEGA domain-containing protein [Polyangia bacterium]|nr:PEGA domain-containing protein [Polyangia bacterium]